MYVVLRLNPFTEKDENGVFLTCSSVPRITDEHVELIHRSQGAHAEHGHNSETCMYTADIYSLPSHKRWF